MGDYTVLVPVVFLLTLSALFSGLNLGFFTLHKNDLKRKAELGDKKAEKLYRLRKNGNLLLCTLLIGNVTVNSVLSIFMGELTNGVIASLVSIVLIVLIGEIIPQALFAHYAMKLSAKLTWLVDIFTFIFYPVAKPLSVVLDKALGEELPAVYSKKELAKIIDQQEPTQETIDLDEKRIMKGALSFSDKTAREVMTPRLAIASVEFDAELTHETIDALRESGHSRIPVYKNTPDNIVGILYVKDMVGHDLGGKRAGDLARSTVIFVSPQKRLDDLLNDFKRTRNHLFVVVDNFGGVLGLVTIEDVIEEIIGAEIVDEFDKYEDLQKIVMNKFSKRVVL